MQGNTHRKPSWLPVMMKASERNREDLEKAQKELKWAIANRQSAELAAEFAMEKVRRLTEERTVIAADALVALARKDTASEEETINALKEYLKKNH